MRLSPIRLTLLPLGLAVGLTGFVLLYTHTLPYLNSLNTTDSYPAACESGRTTVLETDPLLNLILGYTVQFPPSRSIEERHSPPRGNWYERRRNGGREDFDWATNEWMMVL